MGIVELHNVRKVYSRQSRSSCSAGCDFSIEKGDFTSIVGPSGSGKSTILNLIGCIDQPTDGVVSINGTATQGLNDKALTELRHETLGFIFNL